MYNNEYKIPSSDVFKKPRGKRYALAAVKSKAQSFILDERHNNFMAVNAAGYCQTCGKHYTHNESCLKSDAYKKCISDLLSKQGA